LGEEDARTEIRGAYVSCSQVCPEEVSLAQVGAAEVGPDQIGAAQAGSAQVRAHQLGLDQVGTPVVFGRIPHWGTHSVADPSEQHTNLLPVRGGVEGGKVVAAGSSDISGALAGTVDLGSERTSRHQRLGLDQIPEHLVELPHHGERAEHRRRGRRALPPVLAGECHLSDLLAGAEAVEHDTTREASRPEIIMDAATGVRQQVWTGLSGGRVDGEVG
jgi:hypothetical protein